MRTGLFLVLVTVCAACTKTPEPDASSKPPRSPVTEVTSSPAPPPAPVGPKVPGDVAWDAPAAWPKAENPSPMRKATYKIPHVSADKEDAEMSVSQAGGSVDMNVKRWAGQFEPPTPAVKRTDKRVGDLKVTIVEIHGTFSGSGMPGAPAGAPKPGYALLAAIVETATPTFFKITGPDKTVASAKADFDKLVDGMRAK